MKSLSAVLLSLAGLIVAGGCDSYGGPGNGTAEVRFIHAGLGSPPADLVIDDETIAGGISFARVSALADVEAGAAEVEVRSAAGGDVLTSGATTLESGRRYTAIFSRSGDSTAVRIVPDTAQGVPDTPPPPLPSDTGAIPGESKIKLRVIHNAQDAPALDVYLTLDDEPLAGALPLIEPFVYGVGLSPHFPGYVERDPAIWRVRFTADGTHDVLVDTGPIPMAAGQVRSILLIESDTTGLGVANVRER